MDYANSYFYTVGSDGDNQIFR